MRLKLVTPPAVEPVSLDELKSHLRVDIADDDDYIGGLIMAAREYIEETTRRSLTTQTWRLSLDDWPDDDEIELPRPPLQSIISFQYTDSDGITTDVDAGSYEIDTDSEPGQIVLANNQSWPDVILKAANPVQVTYVAGYGDAGSDVPGRLRHAIKLLAAHWYENREPVAAVKLMPIPFAVESLIYLNRVY